MAIPIAPIAAGAALGEGLPFLIEYLRTLGQEQEVSESMAELEAARDSAVGISPFISPNMRFGQDSIVDAINTDAVKKNLQMPIGESVSAFKDNLNFSGLPTSSYGR